MCVGGGHTVIKFAGQIVTGLIFTFAKHIKLKIIGSPVSIFSVLIVPTAVEEQTFNNNFFIKY